MILFPLTQEIAANIVQSAPRCTWAALAAFDIINFIPKYTSGVLEILSKQGFKLTRFQCQHTTTGKLIQHLDPLKSYVIFNSGHVFSVRNGIVVDTCPKPNSVVEFYYEVE